MKRHEWAAHVADWKRSGQTASEYGEPRGLSGKKLYWWSWHLKGKDGDAGSPAVRTRRRRGEPMELVPVTLRPTGSSSGILGRAPAIGGHVEIALPNGSVVRVEPSVDPAWVGRLVAAAGAGSC